MYHLIKGSLAYHKARPFLKPRDISGYMLADTVKQMVLYEADADTVNPEVDALVFYMMNDAFAKLCAKFDMNEPLPVQVDALADAYVRESQSRALRMFYYCLLIITREMRHMHGGGYYSHDMDKEHGAVFAQFVKNISHKNETEAVNHLRSHPPVLTLGAYTKGITDCFNKGVWSSNFGGKAWGQVAHTLNRVVHGEISMEAFMDTAWTLEHNNGAIFNKGMLYTMYGPNLAKILNVQRAGMIPQLVIEVGVTHASNTDVEALFEKCVLVLPDFAAPGYVDWFAVEKWAVGNHHYTVEKKNQVAKYGAVMAVVEPEDTDKVFHVMPGVMVKIVGRQHKKAA